MTHLDPSEEFIAARVRAHLQAADGALDPADRDRLARARARALARVTGRRATPRQSRAWPLPLGAPALALVASAIFVIALLRSPAELPPAGLGSDPVASLYVYRADEVELVEDLDFYQWLAALDRSG